MSIILWRLRSNSSSIYIHSTVYWTTMTTTSQNKIQPDREKKRKKREKFVVMLWNCFGNGKWNSQTRKRSNVVCPIQILIKWNFLFSYITCTAHKIYYIHYNMLLMLLLLYVTTPPNHIYIGHTKNIWPFAI